MKSLYKVIIVYVLISIGTTVKAQYFDWVRSYESCALKAQSDIQYAVTDAEGNVYFTGLFHKGAMLDGEDLLPVEGASWDRNGICIVKYSPDGRLMWHKALWNTGTGHGLGNLLMIGDSVLAYYGAIIFSSDNPRSHEYTYYWDTLMQGAPFNGDSVNIGACTGLVYFNLEDGSVKEQHFLSVGYNDTAGNPIYFYWPGVASVQPSGAYPFTIDNEGNVIIATNGYHTRGLMDPTTHTVPNYLWERGDIGAIRIMVDGERSFYFHSNSCPRYWNPILMKFSPHFDSLLAARFLFEPSNVPTDFDPFDLHVPPTDPSYPQEEYRAYSCNDNTIAAFETDDEGNIYLVGEFRRCSYTANDTLIPVDSAAGLFLSLKMIPYNHASSNIPSYDVNKGYLVKFDPQLRPLYLKQLDWAKRGKITAAYFYHPSVTDSGLIVPSVMVIGPAGDHIIDKYFLLDGDTLPRWLTKSASFLRLDKDDGHLLAYGGLHVVGDWQYRYAEVDKPPSIYSTYAARNNRFAAGIMTGGDILFADSLHHYNIQRFAEQVSAMAIWDYSGHEILYLELSDVDSNYRHLGGALFSDSSLYIYGDVSNMELHFGDTTLRAYNSTDCTTSFIARYVDTAFMRPYVHPVSPPDTQQTEDIRVMVQDDIGCLVAYPNPFRQRVRLRYKGSEPPREAYLTDMQGRRERVELVRVGEWEYSLDFGHLPPAPYLLTLVTHSGRQITARLHSAR